MRHDAAVLHQSDEILNGEVTDTDGSARALIQQSLHASPGIIQSGADVIHWAGTKWPVHHVKVFIEPREKTEVENLRKFLKIDINYPSDLCLVLLDLIWPLELPTLFRSLSATFSLLGKRIPAGFRSPANDII